MYNDLYERINKASKSNSLTFFVGAGVSTLSGTPNWSKLIESFCEELGISKVFSSDDFFEDSAKILLLYRQER
jgi:NAD-dependent SIR2 family protein deacetylase